MAPRCHRRYQAPFDRFRSALLRPGPTLKARTFLRSGRDTCPNIAQRFATREALCCGSQESLWSSELALCFAPRGRATILRPNEANPCLRGGGIMPPLRPRLLRLRHDPEIWLGRFPALRITLLRLLVRNRARNDHIVSLLPVDGRCYLMLCGQLQ